MSKHYEVPVTITVEADTPEHAWSSVTWNLGHGIPVDLVSFDAPEAMVQRVGQGTQRILDEILERVDQVAVEFERIGHYKCAEAVQNALANRGE